MPKSYRIRTEIGINKVIPVNLEQQFDTLEILSLAIFPNDVYPRRCANFGVLCGRVFANRGFGISNARISVFIPLDEIDETDPIISVLYPYKRIEDFNEDGYKYNLLPYTQSHSGHVPVGSFPDRLDVLTNKSVIEVFDKYYKYTTKTNESGDFMIFGLPVGQHSIFMQVDLSDIGEFSLTPQDLIRMGLATETQIDGVKFKFSENYSELPQIITLQKNIQVAPFYGEKDVCNHYIVRTDFDLTSEAGVELKPTAVFMGSIISHNNRKKIKRKCKIPAKAGWLCDLITGSGQIEAIRQTIFNDEYGRPILEEFTLENSGKVIDENGTWVLEVPMNIDYVYTNEDGKKVLSNDPSLGVPTKGKYRFKVKWAQSPRVGEENKRGYFLVPNVKEWGWEDSDGENNGLPSPTSSNWSTTSPTQNISDVNISFPATNSDEPVVRDFPSGLGSYFGITGLIPVRNVVFYRILVNDGTGNFVERPEYLTNIPIDTLGLSNIKIEFLQEDPSVESVFNTRIYNEAQYKQESSYAFSLNWIDYGTDEMINEAVGCEDRFYNMVYNKVYTVSQLIDRFSWQTFPQKSIEIKHVTESRCEGDINAFPANDVYYRYDVIFILFSFILNVIVLPVGIVVIIVLHVLAYIFGIWQALYPAFCKLRNIVRRLKCKVNTLISSVTCEPDLDCSDVPENPFKNLKLGVFLYTDDGCERCKCNVEGMNIGSEQQLELQDWNNEFVNTSLLPDYTTTSTYDNPTINLETQDAGDGGYLEFLQQVVAGAANPYFGEPDQDCYFLLPLASDRADQKRIHFSTSLTLGERINLFNTKAKYYDNPGSLSPGTVGWNQVKVSWWPDLNTTTQVVENNNTTNPISLGWGIGPTSSYDIGPTLGINNDGITNGFWTLFGTLDELGGAPNYLDNQQIEIFDTTLQNPINYTITQLLATPLDTPIEGPNGIINYFISVQLTNTSTGQIYYPPSPMLDTTDFLTIQWQLVVTDTEPTIITTVKNHYDNVFIMLMEKDKLNAGDLITFQNPEMSNDPNVGFTTGRLIQRDSINLKWACRNLNEGECNTIYTTPNTEETTVISQYPSDLEYFEVLHEIPMSAFTKAYFTANGIKGVTPITTTNAFGVTSIVGVEDNCFSLPWRFLNSEYTSSSYEDGTTAFQNQTCPAFSFSSGFNYVWTEGNTVNLRGASLPVVNTYFNNDFPIFNLNTETSVQGQAYTPEVNAFMYQTVLEYGFFTPATMLGQPPFQQTYDSDFAGSGFFNGPTGQVEYQYSAYRYGGRVGYSTDIMRSINKQDNFVVYILQRGVDPHSPKIPMKIDLSRLYGWEDYGALDGRHIIEGEFRMNIPIQSGVNPNDPSGLLLPRHCEYATNGVPSSDKRIFFTSYYYRPDDASVPHAEGIITYSAFTTNMHLYYSALDIASIWNSGLWGNCTSPTPFYQENTENLDGNIIPFIRINPDNAFCGRFYPEKKGSFPASTSIYNTENTKYPCIPDYVADTGVQGDFGKQFTNPFAVPRKFIKADNTRRILGGYFQSEYIEGASVMGLNFQYLGETGTGKLLGYRAQVQNTGPTVAGSGAGGTFPQYFIFSCNACKYDKYDFDPNPYNGNYGYFSPTYITSNQNNNSSIFYWVNTAHTINMNNKNYNVFRTDRLPTSTTVRKNEKGNGYLLHQNNTFAIFNFGESGTTAVQIGGYPVPEQASLSEIDTNEIPVVDDNVINSLIECTSAVNLNSYAVDNDGNPFIRPNNPYSVVGDKVYFRRDMGCYNFVSVPFGSLKGVPTPGGGGGDIASFVEWIRRTTLNFSLCFEIWSHTFSNNWINGTLYAFPFQLATFFDSNNEPTRDYCRHVVYFHTPNQTFYYRSSPYNGIDFIGKENPNLIPGFSNKEYGNRKNLLYPTTIMDLGPKTSYLQELVYSDDYDGYIVAKLPTTSFQNVTDLLNMFVLSRLVNTNFLQQLLPSNDSGNAEGADDPSVKGFFANTRWGNGDSFFNNLLPSLVDADYAQMLSINSEFGITEYGPELYSNDDVFFVNDNNGNSVFGVLFESDNQDRDYISPRRTIWNDNSVFPPPPGNFTNINENSQTIPMYQWRIRYQNSNANDPLQYPTIFGWQSNDFWTSAPDPALSAGVVGGGSIFTSGFFNSKYQKLDRFDNVSEYFKTDITNITRYYRGHIINFVSVTDVDGNVTYEKTAVAPLTPNRRYANTFGGPFHFYFGLIQGASALDRFRTKYVDTNIIYE